MLSRRITIKLSESTNKRRIRSIIYNRGNFSNTRHPPASNTCAWFSLSCCGAEQHKTANVTASRVSITEVRMQENEEQLNYSGSIEADNTVSLGFSIPVRLRRFTRSITKMLNNN